MSEKRKACEAAYRHLATAVIASAFEDLDMDTPSPSASQFFGTDWFSYLCKVALVDNLTIRKMAYEMPGYMDLSARRPLHAIDREKAIRLGRKRQKHGKPRVKLWALPPGGETEPFKIDGYVNAARMIGCTAMAVKVATDQGRPCLGWKFARR